MTKSGGRTSHSIALPSFLPSLLVPVKFGFQFSSGRGVETACRARETAPQDTTKSRHNRRRRRHAPRQPGRLSAPGARRQPTSSFRVHFHCQCHLCRRRRRRRRRAALRTDGRRPSCSPPWAPGAGGGSLEGEIFGLYLRKRVLYLSAARTFFPGLESGLPPRWARNGCRSP